MIVQSIIAVKWFSSQHMTVVLGWNSSIGYLGSNLNIAFSPVIYALTKQLSVPCFVGTFFCLLSFFAGVGYVLLDRYLTKQIKANETVAIFEEQQPKCKDFKNLSALFWIILLYYCVFYLSVDGVTTTINDQIHERFGFSNVVAGNLVLIYYLQLILLSPLIGKIVDKYGKRAHWLIFVGITCLGGQFLLGKLNDVTEEGEVGYAVIIPLLILGFSDSVFGDRVLVVFTAQFRS